MSKRFFTPIDLTGTIGGTSAPERSIKWSDGEGTLEVGLKGGNVKLAVGQEQLALCYNGTGSTLTKGTVVYISGAQGQRPSISKASASSESTSSKTLGVVAEAINNGSEGLVCTSGIVREVNTSTFTEGQALWLSTTAGLISSTMPTQPNHSVFIGYCIKSNASSGQIFVKIQNGYELDELHNVLITSPTTGQTLKYNSATGLWENGSISGGVFEVFYQADSPSSPQLGDIWVESDVDVPEYDNISINTLVPNQSGNSGKYLTTNGTSVSWNTVNSLPSQSGNSGKYLTTDGTTATWGTLDLSTYATISSLSSYAPLSSPALSGVPTAPTATAATNTTQIATTAFVRSEISNLVDSAPGALDTLNELAAAINDDANFATTITTALSGKEPTITSGTTSQYWRGDKSWQTLDKSAVGLSNVENTALSTWAGSSNITTIGTLTNLTVSGSLLNYVQINNQTGTSYTLELSDASRLIQMNNSSANTLTVPQDSVVNFPVGTRIDIVQTGTGQTTIQSVIQVTLNSFESSTKLAGRWAAATLIKTSNNTWTLIGNITT
jgi:hypothetical protein